MKTYSYSVFFLLLSTILLSRSGTWFLLLAGLSFSISVGIRLHFARGSYTNLSLPLFIVEKDARFFTFFIGSLIGALPAVLMLIASTDLFLFNNLGYHQLRNRVGLIGGFHQKISTLRNLIGYGNHTGYISWQFLIIGIAALLENILRFRRGEGLSLYFGIALTLFVVSILPTPVYLQYFCILVPFLVIDAASFFDRLIKKKNFLALGIGLAAMLVFLYPLKQEYLRYTDTGRAIPGVYNKRNALNWDMETLNEVAKAVDEQIESNQEVLTTWPGYLIGTKAKPVSGFENHFPISVAHKLSEKELKLYKIVSKPGLDNLIKKQNIKTSSSRLSL